MIDLFEASKNLFQGKRTFALIVKYKQVLQEWDRVLKGRRGVDYPGGYDDAIANQKTDLEFEINRRSHIEGDKEATDHVMGERNVTIPGQYYAYVLHGIIGNAVSLIEGGNVDEALWLMKQTLASTETDDQPEKE